MNSSEMSQSKYIIHILSYVYIPCRKVSFFFYFRSDPSSWMKPLCCDCTLFYNIFLLLFFFVIHTWTNVLLILWYTRTVIANNVYYTGISITFIYAWYGRFLLVYICLVIQCWCCYSWFSWIYFVFFKWTEEKQRKKSPTTVALVTFTWYCFLRFVYWILLCRCYGSSRHLLIIFSFSCIFLALENIHSGFRF